MVETLLDIAPLAIFIFGAVTFCALTLFYWGERRRESARKPGVFPVFTLVCAAAFVDNLLLQFLLLVDARPWLGRPALLVRDVTTGLLPPLILHLVFETVSTRLPGIRVWRAALAAFYGAAVALLVLSWTYLFYLAAPLMLSLAGAGGLALQAFAGRPVSGSERAHGKWVGALLILMTICGIAGLAGRGAWVGQTPDYLVLAFFSVTLYYKERLAFFDLFVKRAAFLALGLALLVFSFAFLPPALWSPWISAAVLLAFWLLGSWAYPRVASAVDRVWLRRPYSAADAERQFMRAIQAAATEEDLGRLAAESLEAIFQTRGEVRSDNAPLAPDHICSGYLRLAPRPNGIPFLSDDRRLLESLAVAFNVVFENVRFRADLRRQQDREQQLRWHATRAELKALRAQINPHFLFNTLSVIAGLIQDQPELADETIEQLARIFRYTLRKSENEWSLLAEEIEFVGAYLRVEQARFGDRLHVEIAIDPSAESIAVPAMCVQPLVENAITHGIAAAEGPGKVMLRAAVSDNVLSLEVSDTGPGFPANFTLDAPGQHHGLRNVADRLHGYFGGAARLSWDSGPGGSRVVLSMPADVR